MLKEQENITIIIILCVQYLFCVQMFILIVKYFDISLVEAKVFLSQENAGNPERIRMSLAGAGQRRYLAGVERRQLDMLGPVSFISFTIQLYVFTIYFLYTLQTILH